jgi:preprotein translocase subunit SecA
LDRDTLRARLTEAGRATLAEWRGGLAGVWRNERHAVEMVELALAARHLYQRDRHYLVRDDEILIIDPVTGRGAAGRQWSRGLHGLIAQKEGRPVHVEPETLARITYQRFFRRYLRLGGLSGTLAEARGELARVYGLPVVPVPLRRPARRRRLSSQCFADPASRRQAMVARVAELVGHGRAVLVGTDSVAASDEFSAALAAAGIDHALLNARNEHDEAAIVAAAGRPGRVSVATRMAGRGTDIVLDPAVAAAGGLHVLNCQRNDSARLDRQLAGRAGRQGDPGSVEHWLAIDPAHAMDRILAYIFGRRCRQMDLAPLPVPGCLLDVLEARRQRGEQSRQAGARRSLLRQDDRLAKDLAFTGPME